MVVETCMQPDVPVIVTVAAPSVAVLLAVNVNTLFAVVGFVPKEALTPLGRPVAASVTLPVNPDTTVAEMVSVTLLPRINVRVEGEAVNVNAGVGTVIVSVIVVEAVTEPEVPVIVMVEVPPTTQFVELPAVRVSTLLPVDGLVPKDAVTPLGRPDAANVTAPVNPPVSAMEMVSVPVLPCAMDNEAADGVSVKPPAPVQVVPLTAKEVGTALVVPFQVPLNPMPATLPPAVTLLL